MHDDAHCKVLNTADLAHLFADWCRVPGVSFSVGVPGIIAEFHGMEDEETCWEILDLHVRGCCSGGSIRVDFRDNVTAVSFDLQHNRTDGRTCGIVFCLPAQSAYLQAETTLRRKYSVGDAVLFDIGAGSRVVEALVEVDDSDLIKLLDQAQGSRLVGTHHHALKAIIDASPPRLFRTAFAEIAVRQEIATTRTPVGPHTHLLPNLIDGTTHDSRIQVPVGWVPCLTMHVADSEQLPRRLMQYLCTC